MKLLILNEKPDAAKKFSAALGGMSGSFEGNQYRIEALHGHILQLKKPEFQRDDPSWSEDVAQWSNVSRIPWQLNDFKWVKEPKPKPKGSKFKSAKDRVAELKKISKTMDAIVVASDDDPSGEGDLLVQEVIDAIGFKGQVLRCFFADDSKPSIIKAMTKSNLKDVTDSSKNEKLQMALTRERFDFGTMQLSRLATKFCRENQCDVVVRPGRLKSYMVVRVFDRLYEIFTFIVKDLFRPVFIDDQKNVFVDKNIEKSENRDVAELNMQQLKQSTVVISGTQRKSTSPPKLLTYDQVRSAANRLYSKNMKNKEFIDTYQKMYDQNILSYPRTDDKKITEEQWMEMMPLVDTIAKLVDVDPALLTHREPRSNYVTKKQISHGANRPGLVVPKSLDELTRFGPSGPSIYKALALSFLTAMCDDYEYDSTTAFIKDFPTFTSTKNVPAKLGFKLITSQLESKSDDDDDLINVASFGTVARPEIEISKSKSPAAPTQDWLFSDLRKNNIGTGATRVGTMAELLEGGKQVFTEKGKHLLLNEEGYVTGAVLHGTLLATAKVTKQLGDICEAVGKGTMSMEKAYTVVNYIIEKDTPIMKRNASRLYTDSYLIERIPEKKNNTTEKHRGIFEPKGIEISFGKKQMGSMVSDLEAKSLLEGKTIPFTIVKKKGGTSRASVFLEEKSFTDKKTKKLVNYWGLTVKSWL